MKPVDIAVLAVILVVLGLVSLYLHRSKKRGKQCIGCPGGGDCSACGSGCSAKKES